MRERQVDGPEVAAAMRNVIGHGVQRAFPPVGGKDTSKARCS
jgi:hypothetical protein